MQPMKWPDIEVWTPCIYYNWCKAS